MTKKDLIKELSVHSGFPETAAAKLLFALEIVVEQEIKNLGKLEFGHLIVEGVKVDAKSGIIPLTGKPYSTPAYTGAKVKISPSFKKKLKG